MKKAARPSAAPASPAPQPVARKENLYFFAAVFAIMLAGDLIWWQTKQISDEFEHSTANMYSVSRSEVRELEVMGSDIEGIEAEFQTELTELEDPQ